MNNFSVNLDLGLSTSKVLIYDIKYGLIFRKIYDNDKYHISDIEKNLKAIIDRHDLDIKGIKSIHVTGIGASQMPETLFGVKIKLCDELECIGYGGVKLADVKDGLVISMGTGTAFINVKDNVVSHHGGMGLGGGTIMGLAKQLSHTSHFPSIVNEALHGHNNKSDLIIDVDYTNSEKKDVLTYITASNLGNFKDDSVTLPDFLYGSLKMVIQNICVTAAILAKNLDQENIILIGSVTMFPHTQTIASEVGILFDKKFIVPKNAPYATVYGALYNK